MIEEQRREGFNKGAVIAIVFLTMALIASCIIGLRWRRALRKERIAKEKLKSSDPEPEREVLPQTEVATAVIQTARTDDPFGGSRSNTHRAQCTEDAVFPSTNPIGKFDDDQEEEEYYSEE